MESIGIVAIKPDALTWPQASRLFLLRCRSLNLSTQTQALYAVRIKVWIEWASKNGAVLPAQTKPDHVRDYLRVMREQGWKDATTDSAFRILRTLFYWLEREGLVPENPMKRVERPRRERRLIVPFSVDQLRAFFAAIPTRTPIGLRNFAIAAVLADTGARVGEVLSIRLPHLDLGQGVARIMGKGRRERIIPIGQTAQRAILDWLKVRGEIPGMDLLFCNRYGQPLQRRTLAESFQAYGKAAGIEGVRCSPHTMRHFAAITYLRNGGDPLTLQKILGHSSLTMTRLYAEVADVDAIRKHREASPLDKMGPLPCERRRVVIGVQR